MAQQNNRGRQQRIIIIFIVVALLLLVGGAFAILGGDGGEKKRAAPSVPQGLVAVPVASRNIQLGERIASNMFRVDYVEPDRVPPEALLRVNQFLGRYATEPIAEQTIFKETNISEPNMTGGYSAVTKPGKRVVIINAAQLPGTIGTLRVGDHIDLMAINQAGSATGAAGKPSKEQLRYEYMKGGTQPGTPPRRGNAGNKNSTPSESMGLTASLVAENAEVLHVPTRGKDKDLVVLQMNPQDAHVTTLMIAAGASLRVVFRPSNDDETILAERDLTVTTRMPKPEPDPDQVNVIVGNIRGNTRPESERYSPAAINPNYGKQDALANQNFTDSNSTQAPVQIITRDFGSTQVYE